MNTTTDTQTTFTAAAQVAITEAQEAAAAAGLTGRRARPADQTFEYWNGKDLVSFTYSGRGKEFTVTMDLATNVTRKITIMDAITAAGISMLATDGHFTCYASADAEAVEAIVRGIIPVEGVQSSTV